MKFLKAFFRWLFDFDARRREIDRRILWPEFKKQAKTMELARAGYLAHMMIDSAYDGMTESEMLEFMETLD